MKKNNADESWLESYQIRHPQKRAFLAAYAELGNISRAATISKVHRTTHYVWLKDDDAEIYSQAFDDAHNRAIDSLESEARRRAMDGVEKPVYQGGKKVGTVREYSDTLLIFLLKGARPEKYKDRAHFEHSGAVKLEELLSDPQELQK